MIEGEQLVYDLTLQESCDKFLSRHRREMPADVLMRLSQMPEAREPADFYGIGGAVSQLERRVASLLDKEAALFFSTGISAQHAIVKACCEQSGRKTVVVHPMSHMYRDTECGLNHLRDVDVTTVGERAPFDVDALNDISDPPALVAMELPLRRSGYLLPTWEQLVEVAHWAQSRGTKFHIDGARLWEAAAGYGRSLAELAALGDSVYVSFYKGIGGMSGAMVVGDSELIERLKPWQVRLGTRLHTAYPVALAALSGLEQHLPRQAEYLNRARGLAQALGMAGFSCAPAIPQVNAFRVFFDGEPVDLIRAHEEFVRETGVWLFDTIFRLTGESAFGEIVIGDAADDYTDPEVIDWLTRFREIASQLS